MHAELWDSVPDTERVVAEIRVVDKQVQITEREPLSPRLKKDIDFMWRHSTPATFYQTLKLEFRGYMWIKLVKD